MFFIPQLIVLVGKGNSFDLTWSRNKKIMMFEEQGRTDASLIVLRFGNFWQICVNKHDA